LAHLPIRSFLTNAVVAGDTLQMGTRIVSLNGANMVDREVGVVYLYAPGTWINICYGKVTETAKVNQFAQVYAEDLNCLRDLGQLVRDQTMASVDRTVVRITPSLISAKPEPPRIKQPNTVLPNDPDHGRAAKAEIERAIEANWHDEPDDIFLTRLCVIKSGAGTGGSAFPIFIYHKAYLMVDGGGTLFRFLKLAYNDQITLDALKLFTKAIFFETFDHFVFFGDLGLETLKQLGIRYKAALNTVHNKDEYVELSVPLLILLNLFHRWTNLVFPWHYSSEYQHCTLAQVAKATKLLTYQESSKNR
jgi:hypothetical protein